MTGIRKVHLAGAMVIVASVMAAGATANSTASATAGGAVASQPGNLQTCVRVGQAQCYPIGELGPYVPAHGTPEEAALYQCFDDVVAACVAAYPNG